LGQSPHETGTGLLLWVGLVPGALSVLLLVAELFFIE